MEQISESYKSISVLFFFCKTIEFIEFSKSDIFQKIMKSSLKVEFFDLVFPRCQRTEGKRHKIL